MGFALDGMAEPLGQVLHIGAGSGGDLAGYVAAGATAITLVEPDPDALEMLRATVDAAKAGKSGPRIAVVAAAVALPDLPLGPGSGHQPPSQTPGRGRLYRFAFPDLASLRPPSGLAALYPGLGAPETETVALADPVALVRGLDLDPGGRHLLVIEAAAAAQPVLAALDAAGLLAGFARVVVQEGAEALYEGQVPLAETARWLETRPFRAAAFDRADPDRPHLRADLDPRAGELAALRAAQEAALARIAGLEAERDAARAEAAGQAAELAAVQAERDAAARARNAALAEQRLGLRLQVLLQNELTALREAHAALSEEKAAQDRLLAAVTERLAQAAAHLRREAGETAADAPALPRPLKKKTGSEKAKSRKSGKTG
jgi:hypothetical protein